MLRPALLCCLLAAVPAGASERDIEEGARLLSEGARRLLGGVMGQVEPGLRDLAEALRQFEERLPDPPSGYHAPEILPNGDIIIRRRPAPGLPGGAVEL